MFLNICLLHSHWRFYRQIWLWWLLCWYVEDRWYAVVWDFNPTTARVPLMGFFVPCCRSWCRGIFQSHERGAKCRGIENPIEELSEGIKVVGFFFILYWIIIMNTKSLSIYFIRFWLHKHVILWLILVSCTMEALNSRRSPEKNRPSQKDTTTLILPDTCLVLLARIKVSFEFSRSDKFY